MNPHTNRVDPPGYLDEALTQRWHELVALVSPGTLNAATADALARYVIAEQQYLRAVQQVFFSLRSGDAAGAAQWSLVEERLCRVLYTSGRAFGLSPDAELL